MRFRLFARVLGGICYSLLFSSFEAWAIAECDRKKIHRRNLARLFASATFFNAVSAVVAGIIGRVVDRFQEERILHRESIEDVAEVTDGRRSESERPYRN